MYLNITLKVERCRTNCTSPNLSLSLSSLDTIKKQSYRHHRRRKRTRSKKWERGQVRQWQLFVEQASSCFHLLRFYLTLSPSLSSLLETPFQSSRNLYNVGEVRSRFSSFTAAILRPHAIAPCFRNFLDSHTIAISTWTTCLYVDPLTGLTHKKESLFAVPHVKCRCPGVRFS